MSRLLATVGVDDVAKKYRDVRRILRRAGWARLRTEGSHEVWGHEDGRLVVVAAGGRAMTMCLSEPSLTSGEAPA